MIVGIPDGTDMVGSAVDLCRNPSGRDSRSLVADVRVVGYRQHQRSNVQSLFPIPQVRHAEDRFVPFSKVDHRDYTYRWREGALDGSVRLVDRDVHGRGREGGRRQIYRRSYE